jgi:LysR family transcriptional regulator, glycine cleavage system transcriptional activator
MRNLRAFCVAARHGSFKLAADELCLTPSAVSHQMRELETALRTVLFERRTRALELTPPGKRLFDEVEPLLQALDRALAEFVRQSPRRTLRVRVPSFFASELFIPALTSFCETHPQVDLQLDTGDPRPAEHLPGADLSILLARTPPDGLTSIRLFSPRLTAACAREHAPAVARLGREVFGTLALIVHRARPFAWANWADEVGIDAPEPKHVIELDTMAAVVRAAERGIGIALVPIVLCESRFRSGTLVRIFSVQLATAEAYFLVHRSRDHEQPDVRALREWAISRFQGAGE